MPFGYYRCAIPDYENDTYAIQSQFHQQLINATIPPPGDDDEDMEYSKCEIYEDHNGTMVTTTCNQWVYDKSVFKSTFLSEVN